MALISAIVRIYMNHTLIMTASRQANNMLQFGGHVIAYPTANSHPHTGMLTPQYILAIYCGRSLVLGFIITTSFDKGRANDHYMAHCAHVRMCELTSVMYIPTYITVNAHEQHYREFCTPTSFEL